MSRTLLLVALTTAFLIPTLAQSQDRFVSDARLHVDDNAHHFGAPAGAAAAAEVTSAYTSPSTGLTHVYLRQTIGGVPLLHQGDITVTFGRDGSVVHAAGSFLPEAAEVQAMGAGLDAVAAAHATALYLGFTPEEPFQILESPRGVNQETLLSEGGVAREPIEARLMYEPVEGDIRLVWNVDFHEPVEPHFWSIRIDAATGEVVGQDDYVVHDHWGTPDGERVGFVRDAVSPILEMPEADFPLLHTPRGGDLAPSRSGGSYRVYAEPAESPIHTSDRTLVTNPADPVASPAGWHSTSLTGPSEFTTTEGNNVFAYADPGNQNQPNGPNAVPDGGIGLSFDFPVDFSLPPSGYRSAAITNLFYWNNLLHDILWHYGFDEASGNFQQTNFSGQGLGNDYVRAEGQDGGGINNANFLTRPDGQPARMQMYLWNTASPQIDGSFDNGIIAHEYGHGWSIRLTGGPNIVTCLNNRQQMGEGWSDFLGLITTMRPTDSAEQRRGIGTFALNQSISGQGIRPAPYSTSMAENSYTFANLSGVAHPHGTGFVWATMLWEVTWNLIQTHGFDADIHNGSGGNNIAFRLISEAMKLQPCSPGFVDGRDAILAADQALYNGQNAIHIWTGFAKRGLGYSAVQGSSSSISGIQEAFDLPPGMERSITLEADQDLVPAGEFIHYTLTFTNGPAMEPLSNLELTATLPEGLLLAPGYDEATYDEETGELVLSSIDLDTDDSLEWSFRGLANLERGTQVFFENAGLNTDDEFLIENASGSANWHLIGGTQYSNSRAWLGRNEPMATDQYLVIDGPIPVEEGYTLRFHHRYDTEPNRDGGVVEISVGGGEWEDLGDHFLFGGYEGSILANTTNTPLAGRQAFTGNSGPLGWAEVDLSAFAGNDVRIRFRMATNATLGYPHHLGWVIDEAIVMDEVALPVQLCADADDVSLGCTSVSNLVDDRLEGAPAIDLDDAMIEIITSPGATTSFSLSVGNLGDRALAVVAGPAGDDTWVEPLDDVAIIEPSQVHELSLTFDASSLDVGDYEGEIVIVSNDPEAALITLPFTAYVGTVGNDDHLADLPEGFLLEPVYPNPFGDRASVSLRVATGQDVQITLFDVMGREVMRIHEGPLEAGPSHSFSIDGSSLASGVYLMQARGEHFSSTTRITRIR